MEMRGRGTKAAASSASERHSPSSSDHNRDGVLMAQIGKKQQLNVRSTPTSLCFFFYRFGPNTSLSIEKFWLFDHPCTLVDPFIVLGGCLRVRPSLTWIMHIPNKITCSVFYAGLYNGGPVALVYGMILALTGTLALAASLAEMASICPIAGAQYHWTAMFSPPRFAPFITWMQGDKTLPPPHPPPLISLDRLDYCLRVASHCHEYHLSHGYTDSRCNCPQ